MHTHYTHKSLMSVHVHVEDTCAMYSLIVSFIF